ncbi:MAG TPA: LacI family DNA-binding transcriptional regulator [Prolixibacteraceae bacterium]|nr:LacI family DNA-binding transcriptional regulator [Prolixibacteraceae bacterium]
MQKKKATIHDIAGRLNLSSSTVSRALNNSTRISRETRERVRKMALELDYKPNQMALDLRKGTGTILGVIVPRLNRHFFSHAIAGMESVVNPSGYNLMICQSNESYETERKNIQSFIRQRVQGVILSVAADTLNTEHIESLVREGIPVVLFDRGIPALETDQVTNDNFQGAYDITSHLIRQGYKKLIHFSGPMHVALYRERCQGFQQACADAGLPYSNDWVIPDVLTRLRGEAAALNLIRKRRVPDALFAASDYSALGAYLAFKKSGFLIPDQIGIAGFANEPFTELIDPGMTTIEQHGEEIGKSAARMLIERIRNGSPREAYNTLVIQSKLIIRSSTLRNSVPKETPLVQISEYKH